jgi:hypothetical protein
VKPSDFVFEGSMVKRRGNPNWGKPGAIEMLAGPTGFEGVTATLGLAPEAFEGSVLLKEWVRKNKDHKYVPLDLLNVWGFEVKGS